ncbi:MAG: transcription elongation factor GreA [Candidatus Saccharibacteria bacterium]|nr:transcription elongation factor GreA [Candidatus Saccharibacteria bacterium]
MKKQFHLTKEGHAELEAELAALIGRRTELAEAIATARSQGDLAENAEYHEAKEEQGRQESRIEEIENILQNSEIIKAPKGDSKVQLGSTVKLKSADGATKEFQVVGTVEADPLNHKISDESPIGKALLGKKEGEEVEIHTPADTTTYKIVDIS